MKHWIYSLVLLAITYSTSIAEARSINVEVAHAEDKRIVVSIRSDAANENKSKITVAEAVEVLNDAQGWGSLVTVTLQTNDVRLDRYIPLVTAIANNSWLELSSISRMGEGEQQNAAAAPYQEEPKYRSPNDALSEQALLIAAETDQRARHFLADLWDRGLLTPSAREKIVRRHLRFRLREEFPHDPLAYPTLRAIVIFAETDFPFPESAWVEFSGEIKVGDREFRLNHDDFGSSRSLYETNRRSFWSLGGSYEGSPVAMGVIQLREIDRDGSVSESAWIIRTETNSISLENRNAEQDTPHTASARRESSALGKE